MIEKYRFFLILPLLIFFAGCAQGGGAVRSVSAAAEPERATLTLVKAEEDFDQLKRYVLASPKYFAAETELETAFTVQRSLLKDGMSEEDLYRVLMPAVSKLRCGHTSLAHSAGFEARLEDNGRFLPLFVQVSDGKAFVYRSLDAGIPAGSELTAVDGRPVGDIIRVMLDNLTADGENLTKKYYSMSHWFSEIYCACFGSKETFTVSFIGPGERAATTAPAAGVRRSAIREAEQASGTQEEPYSFRLEDGYAVLTVRSFGFYGAADRARFRTFVEDSFAKLSESGVSRLILDLRGNWGGDPYCGSYVFAHLISEPSPYFAPGTPFYPDLVRPIEPSAVRFSGSLQVLTNGACFSTTGHLCSLLRYHGLGTFVGEETAGASVCTDGSQDFTLANSGLRLHLSMRAFGTAVTGQTPGRGIMPDYPVTPSVQDIIEGRDPVMELAVRLARSAV